MFASSWRMLPASRPPLAASATIPRILGVRKLHDLLRKGGQGGRVARLPAFPTNRPHPRSASPPRRSRCRTARHTLASPPPARHPERLRRHCFIHPPKGPSVWHRSHPRSPRDSRQVSNSSNPSSPAPARATSTSPTRQLKNGDWLRREFAALAESAPQPGACPPFSTRRQNQLRQADRLRARPRIQHWRTGSEIRSAPRTAVAPRQRRLAEGPPRRRPLPTTGPQPLLAGGPDPERPDPGSDPPRAAPDVAGNPDRSQTDRRSAPHGRTEARGSGGRQGRFRKKAGITGCQSDVEGGEAGSGSPRNRRAGDHAGRRR